MPDPLDLARCRALAEEAGRGLTLAALQAVAGGADRSFEMATLAQNTVREYHALTTALRAACDEVERAGAERAQAIPADQWREDYGPCLWWKDYLGEAPVVGSPLDSGWAEVNDPDEPFTHFTRIPNPVFPPPGAEVGRG